MINKHFIIGLLMISLGIGLAVLIFHQPQQLRVPAWVAYAAASTFPLAGLVLIAGALGARRLVNWLGVLVVAGLLVPFLWIALGPGPRKCSGSIGGIGVGEVSDWLCRGGFGIASGLGLIMLVLAIHQAVSSKGTHT